MKSIIVMLSLSLLTAACQPMNLSTRVARSDAEPSKQDDPSSSGNPAPSAPGLMPEVGGSNYVFIDLGRFAQEPNDENWFNDVKTPVVHYHQYAQTVREQLDQIIRNGQKKIAIVVWFGGPATPDFQCITWGHTVCPQAQGKLPEVARTNLRSLLQDIAARPFHEVQIRLGHQGTADIHGWTKWEETIYESSKSFILDVVTESEAALAATDLKRSYDLGLELMGHPHITRSWYKRYLTQIWAEYLRSFPVEKTIGFSFNHADNKGMYESLKIFDDSGKRPPRLGFDIYLDRTKVLRTIATVLDLRGWGRSYPIYIQETYRNDAQIAHEFANAKADHGLNILSIVQWPLDQGSTGPSNSVDYTFDRYR